MLSSMQLAIIVAALVHVDGTQLLGPMKIAPSVAQPAPTIQPMDHPNPPKPPAPGQGAGFGAIPEPKKVAAVSVAKPAPARPEALQPLDPKPPKPPAPGQGAGFGAMPEPQKVAPQPKQPQPSAAGAATDAAKGVPKLVGVPCATDLANVQAELAAVKKRLADAKSANQDAGGGGRVVSTPDVNVQDGIGDRLAKSLRDLARYKADKTSTVKHMTQTKTRLARSYLSKANARVELKIAMKNHDRAQIAKAINKIEEEGAKLDAKTKWLTYQDGIIKAKIAADQLEAAKLAKLMQHERELADGVLRVQERHMRDLEAKLIVGKESVATLREKMGAEKKQAMSLLEDMAAGKKRIAMLQQNEETLASQLRR